MGIEVKVSLLNTTDIYTVGLEVKKKLTPFSQTSACSHLCLRTWTKHGWGKDTDGLAHGSRTHLIVDGTILSETPDVLREG